MIVKHHVALWQEQGTIDTHSIGARVHLPYHFDLTVKNSEMRCGMDGKGLVAGTDGSVNLRAVRMGAGYVTDPAPLTRFPSGPYRFEWGGHWLR